MTTEERLAKLERMREIVNKLISKSSLSTLDWELGNFADEYRRLNAELDAELETVTAKPKFRVDQVVWFRDHRPIQIAKIYPPKLKGGCFRYEVYSEGRLYDEFELNPLTPEQI